MSEHDRIVLDIATQLLRGGSPRIQIGEKVINRQKIGKILKNQFPNKKILIGKEVV